MSMEAIKKIMTEGSSADKKAFLAFDTENNTQIYYKFQAFARGFFPRFFTQKSAPFHRDMAMDFIESYIDGKRIVEIAFRGASKTSILKLFVVFVLLNDTQHRRKYIKIVSKGDTNSRAFVTDVFNMMIELKPVYGDVFIRSDDKKREQSMNAFLMTEEYKNKKISAGTVAKQQRGHITDASRPDWVIFDDVEDRESVSSAVITESIIKNIDEAITGLALNGTWVAPANYISDMGVVQRLIDIADKTRITPLLTPEGEIVWQAITPKMVEEYKKSLDFYGEYMCDPSRTADKFFDIERIEHDMKNCTPPTRTAGHVKYWGNYQPHHAYGLGSDHSEGIGQDSNTMTLIDFNDGSVVATHASNTIAPDLHAHECIRVVQEYGNCIWAPETNNRCGGIVLATARQAGYTSLYRQENVSRMIHQITTVYGWNTSSKTKTNAFMEYRTAYNDGLIKINDTDLLKEMKQYTNNDVTDSQQGLVTRHFDLLMSAVIAWQTRKQAVSRGTEIEDEEIWENQVFVEV